MPGKQLNLCIISCPVSFLFVGYTCNPQEPHLGLYAAKEGKLDLAVHSIISDPECMVCLQEAQILALEQHAPFSTAWGMSPLSMCITGGVTPNNDSLSQCTTICLFICLLRDTLIVSTFGQL